MPTYEYACKACGHRFEIVQKFSDAALTECPQCTGALRKVFGNVGITFKGSGFYKTDSRSSNGSSSSSSSSSGDSASSTSTSPSTSTSGGSDSVSSKGDTAKSEPAKSSSSSGGAAT